MVAGYLIGEALIQARSSQRAVSVRGLAERQVPANLALWPNQSYTADPVLGTICQNKDFRIALSHAIDREEIAANTQALGEDLDEHIGFVLAAMKGIATELGLDGSPA